MKAEQSIEGEWGEGGASLRECMYVGKSSVSMCEQGDVDVDSTKVKLSFGGPAVEGLGQLLC